MKIFYTLSFIIALLSVLFANDLNAQSLVLKDINNQTIANGDTIIVSGDTSAVLYANVYVENISGATKTVDVSKTILIQPVGVGYFAWDNMYDTSATISFGLPIIAGATVSNFVAYYQTFGVAGTAFYRYTFFDENNPNDSASVVIEFNVYDYTGIDENAFADFSLFPNPGKGNFQICFPIPIKQELSIAVFTNTGQLISTEKILTGPMRQELNLENYAAGIYFGVIQCENKYLGRFKLIVQ